MSRTVFMTCEDQSGAPRYVEGAGGELNDREGALADPQVHGMQTAASFWSSRSASASE